MGNFFFFLAARHAVFSLPTRDQTCSSSVEAWSLNRWTTREVSHGDIKNGDLREIITILKLSV